MTSAFFTTDDGDIVLHAGTEPGAKHDFRVHKFILSLASPVFKDMFAFPQPSDQNENEHPDIPVVDIPDSPEVFDTILRYIYPGVELPKITEILTLSALFSAADKYNIASICPVLKESLKAFLPKDPFGVYIIACRFGFLEETKQAANLTIPASLLYPGDPEVIQLISSTDLFRLVQFVQQRERDGRVRIGLHLDPITVGNTTSCEHGGKDTQDYYSHLEKKVELVFAADPYAGRGDLFAVLDSIPDPPPGCDPLPMSGNWYSQNDDEESDAFRCPLQPMTIRSKLTNVADMLRRRNEELLQHCFGNV